MLPALDGLVLARLRPACARGDRWSCSSASGLSSRALGLLRAPAATRGARTRGVRRRVCEALAPLADEARRHAQTFNHPVALCGRPIVAGYAGHLWSHGLDSAMAEARLKHLMQGRAGWQDDARALGASHLFWGAREASAFPGSTPPLGEPRAAGRVRALGSALPARLTWRVGAAPRQHQAERHQHDGAADEGRGPGRLAEEAKREQRRDHAARRAGTGPRSARAASAARGSRGRGRRASARRRAR